jgi:hypothetical protein
MLLGIIAGLCVVYLMKLHKLGRLVAGSSDPNLVEWARLEGSSIHAFLYTGAVAIGVRLIGCFFFQYVGSEPLGAGRLDKYMSPTIPLLAAPAVIALVGLVISAIKGSKAMRFREKMGVTRGVTLGTGAKIGLFATGWFAYFFLLRVVHSFTAAAQGMWF